MRIRLNNLSYRVRSAKLNCISITSKLHVPSSTGSSTKHNIKQVIHRKVCIVTELYCCTTGYNMQSRTAVLPARRCASAVLAMARCLSVSESVISWSSVEKAEQIELVLAWELSHMTGLSQWPSG